ncbi:MAG: N-acetylneuraminate synthase family protein [Candidatus Pacebacteria bacterium]|nr:N-acetylneuraminate synthase family protein [Candidatus Paceibacterota bacterium]
MKKVKIKNKVIGNGSPCFVIAEAGSNHDGKFEQAKKLIDVAAFAGADAVKFQLFRAAKIYPKTSGKVDTPAGKIDLYKFFEQVELPSKWLFPLKKYSEKKGLIFIVSPFDEESADLLEKIKVEVYKIASPELNHIPLIRHIAKKKKPMILAEGLSTLSDIEEALNTAYKENNFQTILLHCVSSYPAPPEDYNLNVIETLRRVFQVLVGISDHTLDPVLIPKLGAALGISAIEKHFTISRKLEGPDHPFAIEPEELKLMVKEIRETEKWSNEKKSKFLKSKPLYEKILGTSQKVIAPSEKVLYPGDKRSIFTIKDVKKGEKLGKNNIAVLRAERYLKPGIHPRYFNLVLGKKATKLIKKFSGLQWDNLLTI